MKMMIQKLGAALAVVLCPAVHAQSVAPLSSGAAACQLRIETPSSDWIIKGYDPFGGDAPISTFDLVLLNSGDKECRVLPVFSTDGSVLGLQNSVGTSRIPYNLIDVNDDYDATPVSGRTLRNDLHRPVVVGPHSQQLVRYVLNIAVSSAPGDGVFTQHLLIDAQDPGGQPVARSQVVAGIEVLPSATMGLAGAFRLNHGQADIDLGELSEGTPQLPLQLQVHSTRAYTIEADSLNSGYLRLAGTEWEVPYQLAIGDKTVSFGARTKFGKLNAQGMRLDNLPVTFHIGDARDRRAGTYADVLTLTVSVD